MSLTLESILVIVLVSVVIGALIVVGACVLIAGAEAETEQAKTCFDDETWGKE